jgi:hypothetical protein
VDSGLRLRVSSPELTLSGGSGHEGSPGWLQHEEGQAGNLTEVFGDRLDGEVRPATKRNKRRWWRSMWGEWRHREAKQKVGRGAVGCCSARGAFFRPVGLAEGLGGERPMMEFNFTGFGNEMGRGVDETPS